jgi:cytochrome bd-type quinol oxidase subunit 2
VDSQILIAVLIVVAAIGGVTWLAINARQPRLQSFFRYLLLTVAIVSTTMLIVSAALFVLLARGSADSPAAAVPMVLAVIFAVVAVPAWIGFVVQERCKSGKQPAANEQI